MSKIILMFSGGLDSVCAGHMLKEMGHDIIGIHFILPFASGLGLEHAFVKKAAAKIGIELRIIEEGEEFLSVMRNPKFGFGSSANPCIDCRSRRMRVAKQIMEDEGACCVATGEVIGQRPMSQRRDAMSIIQKNGELRDQLLRPLCAKKLEPTRPEIEGLVDREKLFDWQGRGRKPQIAYAKKFGLIHGAPGGGCFLTEQECADRFDDLTKHKPDWNLADFKMLYWGRWFRISESSLLMVGRNADENEILMKLVRPDDLVFRMAEITGPYCIGRGTFTEEETVAAAAMVARCSRARDGATANVVVERGGESRVLAVVPASEELRDTIRI